jgi:hypothetical protein
VGKKPDSDPLAVPGAQPVSGPVSRTRNRYFDDAGKAHTGQPGKDGVPADDWSKPK